MNVGAKILTLDQEHRFTWQGNLGADLLFKGLREFTLEPVGPGKTQVRHVESITGLIAPLFLAVRRTGVAAHHHGFNACLKERSEEIARA